MQSKKVDPCYRTNIELQRAICSLYGLGCEKNYQKFLDIREELGQTQSLAELIKIEDEPKFETSFIRNLRESDYLRVSPLEASDPKDCDGEREYLLRELSAIETCTFDEGGRNRFWLAVARRIFHIRFHLHEWEAAIMMVEECLKKCKEWFGEGHERTVEFMILKIDTLRSCGQLEEAKALLLVVLNLSKESRRVGHPDSMACMIALASICKKQGNFEQAAQIELLVLELKREHLGVNHPDTLTTENNLAFTYKSLERFAEAERLYKEIITASSLDFRENGADILTTRSNLAEVYLAQDRLEEAEETYKEVVAGRENVLGEDHFSTLNAKENLAVVHIRQGRLEEAESSLQHIVLTHFRRQPSEASDALQLCILAHRRKSGLPYEWDAATPDVIEEYLSSNTRFRDEVAKLVRGREKDANTRQDWIVEGFFLIATRDGAYFHSQTTAL